MWGMSINQTLLGGQNGQSLLGLEASRAWGLRGVGWAPTSPFWPCPMLNIARFPDHASLLGWWLKTLGYLMCFGSCCLCNRSWCSLLLRPREWHEEPVLPSPRQALQRPSPQPPEGHFQTLSASNPAVSAIHHRGVHVFSHRNEWRLVEASSWIRPQVSCDKLCSPRAGTLINSLSQREKEKNIYSSCKSLFFPLDQCVHPHSTSVGVLSQIKSSKWLNGKNNNVSMHPYRFSSILWF